MAEENEERVESEHLAENPDTDLAEELDEIRDTAEWQRDATALADQLAANMPQMPARAPGIDVRMGGWRKDQYPDHLVNDTKREVYESGGIGASLEAALRVAGSGGKPEGPVGELAARLTSAMGAEGIVTLAERKPTDQDDSGDPVAAMLFPDTYTGPLRVVIAELLIDQFTGGSERFEAGGQGHDLKTAQLPDRHYLRLVIGPEGGRQLIVGRDTPPRLDRRGRNE